MSEVFNSGKKDVGLYVYIFVPGITVNKTFSARKSTVYLNPFGWRGWLVTPVTTLSQPQLILENTFVNAFVLSPQKQTYFE